ncbi:MAG: hypothetical protein CMJ94_13680 [Planctomycetes bacterium]|nr:hypothetical protein [Planctomycetota bacterium]
MSDSLSRRHFLRGLGACVALPWMASLPGMSPVGRSPLAPKRSKLIYFYVPNGVHMPDWTPQSEGKDFELPWILEPLAPYREHFSVLTGLTQDKARANGDGPGDHARAAAVFLTGVQPLKTDGQIRLGASADQLAAAQVGAETPFPSLVLGCEKGGNAGQCDSGYSCAYSSNISWQNETTPALKEVRPRLLFERLFRGGASREDGQARAERLARRRSVLDYVHDDAKRLQRDLAEDDRVKLDEYLSGVRELERRIENAEQEIVVEVPDSARPDGIPRDFGAYLRLMSDMVVLALRTDRTRVVSFLMANEGSNRAYPMLDIRDGHHELSHHKKDPAKEAQIRKINRFHVEQLAHFMSQLVETQDGGRALIDEVQMVYGSGISDGNRHNHDDLPVLLIGHGAGKLKPGRHQRFAKETPMNNLHLRLLDNMGVRVKEDFGDATGLLQLQG